MNEEIKYIPSCIGRLLRRQRAYNSKYALKFLLNIFLPLLSEQFLYNRSDDKTYLAISYIVLSLRFDQCMLSKQSYPLSLYFLRHPLNKAISDIFHDDRLQFKNC